MHSIADVTWLIHVESEYSDQSLWMPRLILVCLGHTCVLIFLMHILAHKNFQFSHMSYPFVY